MISNFSSSSSVTFPFSIFSTIAFTSLSVLSLSAVFFLTIVSASIVKSSAASIYFLSLKTISSSPNTEVASDVAFSISLLNISEAIFSTTFDFSFLLKLKKFSSFLSLSNNSKSSSIIFKFHSSLVASKPEE